MTGISKIESFMKNFEKKDEGFICKNCGAQVEPLGYTSRDHCNKCLCSIHVDIMPGDRQNTCHGLLEPIDVEVSGKKGYVIVYKCQKCGEIHKNKMASDDDFDRLLEIFNKKLKAN